MYKLNLALNNLQELICHKTLLNQCNQLFWVVAYLFSEAFIFVVGKFSGIPNLNPYLPK